jgi:hypothetical protein
MLAPLLLCLGLVGDAPEQPSPEAQAAYRAARAQAGRDAEAHVRLALWCERHAMPAQRLRHLTLAVLYDPGNATARGLMGLVKDADAWRKPEQVADRIKADAARAAALAQYNGRRDKATMKPDDQFALALWCEQNGLAPEAEAHFTAVVRLDPSRADAWEKLGCRRYRGQWLRPEQIEASKAEAKAQEKADREWSARLLNLKRQLADGATAGAAEAQLAAVSDPRAVPSVWKVFVASKAPDQARAVQLLAQIDAQASSRALAALAVFGQTPEVRRVATESLHWRDPREFLAALIGQVRKPLKYEVRPVGLGQAGGLFVEGVRYNLRRVYQAPQLPANSAEYFDVLSNPGNDPMMLQRAMVRRVTGLAPTTGSLGVAQAFQQAAANPGDAVNILSGAALGANGPNSFAAQQSTASLMQAARDEQALERAEAAVARNVAAVENAVAQAQSRLAQDVAEVEATNQAYHETNNRVLPVLGAVTGKAELGPDPEAWASWWADQQGYVYDKYDRKPTIEQYVAAPVLELTTPRPVHSACFAAGTPVHTLDGPRAIEDVRLGDRVLAQHPETGRLEFLPVVGVFHNPPSETFRVALDGETIVATGIHRFWVAGRGWVMARDLKPGDTVRTVGGLASVASIQPASTVPVFNLEVPGSHDYFVGRTGYLVHDYSLIEAVDHPFDAVSGPGAE